jgi:hypothetical protein
MTETLTDRPAYREPWTHGAYAYPQADTIDAAAHGVRRKRKPLTVHVAHSGLTGRACDRCGNALDAPYPVNADDPPDQWHTDRGGYAYVDIDPHTGRYTIRHYYCAWTSTLAAVHKFADYIR